MQSFSKRQRSLGLGISAVALFALYSVTAWHVADLPVFSSPDETANYQFAQQVRATGIPKIPTTLPGAGRSVINTGTAMVPGSFPFFPWLLGTVGRFSGTFGILIFGPLLATVAVFAWYDFLRRLGGPVRFAALATVLFATFPITWFYASRGLWQNGVFVSGLVLCLWLSLVALQRRTWALSALAGLAWGTTLMVRPSEGSWLAAGLLIFTLSQWRRIPWKHVCIAFATALLPCVLAFSIQHLTYGHASSVGYRTEGILTPAKIYEHANVIRKVANVFFPFGVNARIAAQRFWDQYGYFFGFFAIPALLGLGMLALRKRTSLVIRWLLVASFASGLFLILLYGNFKFIEYPVSKVPTLGSSYERYWLPLILLTSVGGAWLLHQLARWKVGRYATALIVLAWLGWSGWVIGFSDIGIRQTFATFSMWQDQARWIASVTPQRAFIIGNDKIVDPPRHVVGVNLNATLVTFPLTSVPSTVPAYFMLDALKQLPTLQQMYPGYSFDQPQAGPGLWLVQVHQP